MRKMILTMITLGMTACSSAPQSAVDLDHIGEETVIQSFGKADSLKHADPFRLDGGKYISTGFVTIPGDHRPEAAIKMAQANARSLVSRTVAQRLESFLQASSEGTSGESQQLREVITESSKLDTSEWTPGRIYYEKLRVISESGLPRLEYRVWAEITLDQQLFKRQVLEAIRSQQGFKKASVAFSKSVDRNWQKLLGEEAQSTEARNPASEE